MPFTSSESSGIRQYSPSSGQSQGVLSLSQSGVLKMWEMTSQGPQTYLDVDALYHVGNCVKTLFLHYKRIRPPTVGESNKVDVEDGDMIIIAGNEKLAFLNPYDAQKPVLRRLSIPEGHVSMAQWRNLVMVGTKAGAIIGRS